MWQSGRQQLGAFFNIIAYYVLALPIGITLAFRQHIGLQGLWIGMPGIIHREGSLTNVLQAKSSDFSSLVSANTA